MYAALHISYMLYLQSLEVIKSASEQIQQNKNFAKILELVLVMGNELNKATNKPLASAFKVSSLIQVSLEVILPASLGGKLCKIYVIY